ncbi:hypothetical protein [Mangrovibacillus cuniculi]|uniref:Group-specific protein n=1 Tax=Mangrovibacillus cuniculi TaxID=2593652 RepID=A0A7S8CCX6_9BACI|nr:hypothetical protein [Mangrovibacillus cuniculi]QPC47685.1 hypothetical protein G8O30_12325 [Mangrovibacillus cuniculi]
MLKDLSAGVKISITRSINIAFEQYMADIKWEEERFAMADFMQAWRKYIEENASWYEQLTPEQRSSEEFHSELANKINETINKILGDEPTEEQIAQLDKLQAETGDETFYSCKLEAKYLLEKLEADVKKKSN